MPTTWISGCVNNMKSSTKPPELRIETFVTLFCYRDFSHPLIWINSPSSTYVSQPTFTTGNFKTKSCQDGTVNVFRLQETRGAWVGDQFDRSGKFVRTNYPLLYQGYHEPLYMRLLWRYEIYKTWFETWPKTWNCSRIPIPKLNPVNKNKINVYTLNF